ncbi:MAG: hypothetical protein KDE24_20930, partial [Caldilinea sp.]|nr:hypothetical protein [Caldilinea sp.]
MDRGRGIGQHAAQVDGLAHNTARRQLAQPAGPIRIIRAAAEQEDGQAAQAVGGVRGGQKEGGVAVEARTQRDHDPRPLVGRGQRRIGRQRVKRQPARVARLRQQGEPAIPAVAPEG